MTSGLLTGTVQGPDGTALSAVRVFAQAEAGGAAQVAETDRSGRFVIRQAMPGTYRLVAEKLGYQPKQLEDVPLVAGRSIEVRLVLAPLNSTPDGLEVERFAAPAMGWSRPGFARWSGRLESDAIPHERTDLHDLAGTATFVGPGLGMEGLPGSMTQYVLDGARFAPLLHPHLSGSRPLSPRPLSGTYGLELLSNPLDVEWHGAAGGFYRSTSIGGGNEFRGRAWGFAGNDQAGLGYFSDGRAGSYDVARGGAQLSGPLIADTAFFALGAEWRRVRSVQPRAWRVDELPGAIVWTAARDSGVSLSRFTVPALVEEDVAAAFARLDWQIAEGHGLEVHADATLHRAAQAGSAAFEPGPEPVPEGMSALGGIVLRSVLNETLGNELRISVDRTERTYDLPDGRTVSGFLGSGIPQTRVVDGALLFGVDPRAPAEFTRTGFQLEDAVALRLDRHIMKAGVTAAWNSHDREYGYDRIGRFVFGDASAFGRREGAYVQSVGAVPYASFSSLEIGLFLQDAWNPAPGLEVTGGFHLSQESFPDADVRREAEWQRLTGLDNSDITTDFLKFSPRIGFTWDLQARHQWVVRGGLGIYHDALAPDVMAELVSHDGRVTTRRGIGSFGDWPAAPDSATAPVQGPALALMGPEFRPPSTTRASLGVSRLGATAVHLSGTYRQTEYLPSRRDLNRLPAPAAYDQYGRPIYGELVKQGGAVMVVPGTNRRFPSFDIVSALEATASSDYWDVGALVERRLSDRVRLAASYTFSRTRDNWLAHPGVVPEDALVGFERDSLVGENWAEGVSDFDVPHSFALAAELRLPLPLAPSLATVYRVRSGIPFTPGFRDGVDINGDYSWNNDVAFVDDGLAGMDDVMAEWDCLRDQAGEFAERNSCRGEAIQALDLRLSFDVMAAGGFRARMHADALNLLEQELAVPDRALYMVDAATDLDVDAAAGTVGVPLVVNPHFGKPLRTLGSSRLLRLGLEVTF